MDQVRRDADWLAKVIQAGDTSVVYRGHKVATENRLLTKEELDLVSYVLGKKYVEARWIRHRLFKGDGGLSIVFKTDHGQYSEAFAGSGEVAVTSCVVQVLAAGKGTLVLLDEPEVSLHPGAQERLLALMVKLARTKQLQVIFSTHSPHLLTDLPSDAIKTFHQLDDGRFAVLASTHPYAAFRRLGAIGGGKIRVLVEDRLASAVVKQALLLLTDPAKRDVFSVEFPSGGADAILKYHVPVLVSSPGHTLVLLDGDKRRLPEFVDPASISEAQNDKLGDIILASTGVAPEFNIDGGVNGGNLSQRVAFQRAYLSWIRKNVAYIPTTCPEELVTLAAGFPPLAMSTSQGYKDRLYNLAVEFYGAATSSERTDLHGETLLAGSRKNSRELAILAELLSAYLESVHA